MKHLGYILIVVCAFAYSASAAWTLFPIATNQPQSITTAHLMELYEAVEERCRVTMVPSITNNNCNWTEPNGVSNSYEVTPPAYSYTIPLSTGLYVSSLSTQLVVAGGVTSAIVLTNWSIGFKNIPCTNFVCYDTNTLMRYTNRFYQTALMMRHLDDKLESLRNYFLPPSVVATESVATAYFNDYFAQSGSVFAARGRRFPYMSETNWASLTGAGADDIYPNVNAAPVGAMLSLPSEYFTEMVLGEIFFVSTNSYLITNGNDVLTFRDISMRYVDREELDIASVRMSVWSNPANPIRWRWVAPTNGYPSPPALSYQFGGMERYVNSASNRPVQTNFSATITLDGGGTIGGLNNRNVYDLTNATSALFASQDIDGVYPKFEGSVIQFYWSTPVAYYSQDFLPGMVSAETLNARYRLLEAMRYSRVAGQGELISELSDQDWLYSIEQSGEETNCAEAITDTSITTYQYPDIVGGEAWGYSASVSKFLTPPDRYSGFRYYANSKWKVTEVSYSLTGHVAHGWALWNDSTNPTTYSVEYMGASVSGSGIASTQLVSVAKFGPTAFPDWPACSNSYSKSQWRPNEGYNPYYIEWAFDKASWTP